VCVCVCVCVHVVVKRFIVVLMVRMAGREVGQYVKSEIITPISPRYEVEEKIQGERLSNRAVKRL
jgi:hypothetical protein